jgi:hypothetical protein
MTAPNVPAGAPSYPMASLYVGMFQYFSPYNDKIHLYL